MSSSAGTRARAAGSVLLHHLGLGLRALTGPASAPTTTAALAAGRGQHHRLLSISASEARAEVAEVYASKTNYAGVMSAKAELAIISAAEARADVAEVYASKEEDGDWKGTDEDDAPVYQVKVNPVTSAVKAKAEVAEAKTARDR